MRNLLTGAALLCTVLVANPSHAATNLDCMDSGYTAEQAVGFENF